MIRIQKPQKPPDKLVKDGKKRRRSHCSSYSRNPTAYQSGAVKFAFDSGIYAHNSVKQALKASQYNKCCFCERLVGNDGDVEHFRPKQAYKQSQSTALKRPGYYWLAYEWDNLYLACTGCNQRHKQNLFPLQNPSKRATNHQSKISEEIPLFLDPGQEDPEMFISFRGEFAYAVRGNRRGNITIDALQLNEYARSLPEARLQRLQMLKALWQVIQLAQIPKYLDDVNFQAEARKAKVIIEKAQQDTAEFSAAVRWAVRTQFEFVKD